MQIQSEKYLLKILPTLNESQTRWFIAREAALIGRGGIQEMCNLTGMSAVTIRKGIKELKSRNKLPDGERIRKQGGGRLSLIDKDPDFNKNLDEIMTASTAGNPMSSLLWTHNSCEAIALEMNNRGFTVSDSTIQRLLSEKGYTLQSNSKNIERVSSHKDRDSQFQEISKTVDQFLEGGLPVISVDAKKKEKIGNFKNNNDTWRKKGDSIEVNAYDFESLAKGKAIPYGAYDISKNEGFVNVGTSADTGEFAVNSIRQWWQQVGKVNYPNADKILICADGGGSNGSRNRSWKFNLQELANEMNINIHICHFPPGTSKWNKIEHRMFSYISMNWRGKPLVDFETVINLIGSTKTKKGLKVKANLDTKIYEKGIKISDKDMKKINLKYGSTNPKWNYEIAKNG